MRLAEVTLHGVTYPAAFTLRVAMRIAEKYGSVDAVLERDLPPAAAIERKAFGLAEMLKAGEKLAAAEGRDTPAPPDMDGILDGFDATDAGEINRAILNVISIGSKTTVETEPDSKNAAATQDP